MNKVGETPRLLKQTRRRVASAVTAGASPRKASLIAAAALLTDCRTRATQVLVAMDTDAPANRTLSIRAFVRDGDGTMATDAGALFVRQGDGGGISLPATFGVVPAAMAARDSTVTLVIEAQLDEAGLSAPALSFRRVARFAFLPQTTTLVPIFLSVRCGLPASNCTSVPSGQCTVSARCEEAGLTCGDQGMCVTPLVQPMRWDGGVPGFDVAPAEDAAIDVTPDAGSEVTTDAGEALAAPRPLSPLSTSSVSVRRPALRWQLDTGTDGAVVELCRDRACASPASRTAVTGTQFVPDAALATGVWYWRLRPRSGPAEGTRTGPTWQFEVPSRDATVSTSYASAPDFNGDGFADIVVGEPFHNAFTGRVHVMPGPMPSAAGARVLVGSGPQQQFGIFARSAGDMNGDGYADLLVGAVQTNNYGGAAVFYSGGPAGLDALRSQVLASPAGGSGLFGLAFASTGDFDGDGFGDVAIGARAFPGGGRVFVYFGSATGPGSVPGEVIASQTPGATVFGAGIAGGGDLDGDGYGDLAVVALDAANRVEVEVFHGGPRLAPHRSFTIATGEPQSPHDSRGSVAMAGDVNGDGYCDLIYGTSGAVVGAAANSGRFRVALGGSTSSAPIAFDGTAIPDQGYFGHAVALLGDVDGDGFGDVAVSEFGVAMHTGRVSVYRGSATGLGARAIIDGPFGTNSDFGWAIGAAHDVNGDGFADLIVGAEAWNGATGAVALYTGDRVGIVPTRMFELMGMSAMSRYGASVVLLQPRRPASRFRLPDV